MTNRKTDPVPDDVNWSLTTFEGARREQLRRWAELPLEDVIGSLEEMEELSRRLRGVRESAGPGSLAPSGRDPSSHR